MDIRQLRYFLEIIRQNSFSKAAQTIHISQPTLSKVIRTMEEELNMPLFERSTRRVRLTDAGELLARHARRVIQAMEDLEAAFDDLAQLRAGTLRLGLPPVIGVSFFASAIAEYKRRYPQIRVELIEEGGKDIEKAVMDGNVDVGVVVMPVSDGKLGTMPLLKRRLKLVLSVRHPLKGRTEVELKQLRNERFILFRKGFSLHDRVREACVREGFEPIVVAESSQWDLIGEMVAAGLGVSFLPETICEQLNREKLWIVPHVHPAIPWNLALIWNKDRYFTRAAREWVEIVGKSLDLPANA
jgi:DNA-binding transcriptional LysR family regulator